MKVATDPVDLVCEARVNGPPVILKPGLGEVAPSGDCGAHLDHDALLDVRAGLRDAPLTNSLGDVAFC